MTRTEVEEMLEKLFPMYERQVTDEAVNAYFHVLRHSSGKAIMTAASRWLSDPEKHKAPTAAELNSMIGNSRSGQREYFRCPEPKRSELLAEQAQRKREKEARVQAIADAMGIDMNSTRELDLNETLDQLNALRSPGSPVADFLAECDRHARDKESGKRDMGWLLTKLATKVDVVTAINRVEPELLPQPGFPPNEQHTEAWERINQQLDARDGKRVYDEER